MYRKMYTTLFNALTDAIRELEIKNYGRAEEILKKAQCDAEDIYIVWEEQEEASPSE